MGPVASHQLGRSWVDGCFSGPCAALTLWPAALHGMWTAGFVRVRRHCGILREVVFLTCCCCCRRWPAGALCVCRLTPYLASLSTSQLKLLTIYYNRAQGKQQAESHM